MWPDLQKPDIIAHSFYCTITFWALKPFFGSNIKFVLQRNFQLQAVKARDAIHGFVCTPTAIKLHAFNYTAIIFLIPLAYKV